MKTSTRYYAVALAANRWEILISKPHRTMEAAARAKAWMRDGLNSCRVALCKADSSTEAGDKAASAWARFLRPVPATETARKTDRNTTSHGPYEILLSDGRWTKVSRNIFECWAGSRKLNGRPHYGPSALWGMVA